VTLPTLIGMLGVVIVLIAYGAMTAGRLASASKKYQWLNVVGTACILVSLIDQWNLPAFIANAAWIAIGIFSLFKIYRRSAS
jgi:hypothetical protein